LDHSKVDQYKKMDFSKAPPIVMGDGYILDGYHRTNVAKALGIPSIRGYVGVINEKIYEAETREEKTALMKKRDGITKAWMKLNQRG